MGEKKSYAYFFEELFSAGIPVVFLQNCYIVGNDYANFGVYMHHAHDRALVEQPIIQSLKGEPRVLGR